MNGSTAPWALLADRRQCLVWITCEEPAELDAVGSPCPRFHGVDDSPAQLELVGGKIQQLQKLIDVPDVSVYRPAPVQGDVLHGQIVDRRV